MKHRSISQLRLQMIVTCFEYQKKMQRAIQLKFQDRACSRRDIETYKILFSYTSFLLFFFISLFIRINCHAEYHINDLTWGRGRHVLLRTECSLILWGWGIMHTFILTHYFVFCGTYIQFCRHYNYSVYSIKCGAHHCYDLIFVV